MTAVCDQVVRVECAGESAFVTACGAFDRDSSHLLQEALTEAAGAGCRFIVIDFDLVTFIDASTVRVLLACRQEMLDRCGTVVVRHVRGTPALVLDCTGSRELLCDPGSDDGVEPYASRYAAVHRL